MKRSTIHLFFAGIAVCLLLPALWQSYKVYNSQRIVNAINQVPESLTEYDPEVTGTAHPGVLLEIASALSAGCLLYTSPSPRDRTRSRMPSSA